MMEVGVASLRVELVAEKIDVQIVHGGEIDLGLLWAVPRDELRRFTLAQTGGTCCSSFRTAAGRSP